MRSSKQEKRAMAHQRSSLSTLTAGRPLPAALLVGSVALMGLVTSAFADGEGASGDEEATAASALNTSETSSASDEGESSEVRHGPAQLRAPAGHGPPRLRARLKAKSEASEESTEAVASEEGAEKDEAAASDATDEAPLETLGLPTGADKSGVTSKTLSIPKASGSIKGMDESFSAQLSTGIATFSIPLAVPAARGDAQPALALSYSSSSGHGVAGVGWELGVPFIARQTDRGVPGYDDRADWHANQDRFVFNGGQELVPICLVGAGLECDGALTAPHLADGAGALAEEPLTEQMPVWSSGWQYFRPRVEGSFLRFFWSSDHRSWRVQDKSGVTMELGVPLDGSNYAGGLELNADKPQEVYRWHLTRQYDAHGSTNSSEAEPLPLNVVAYRYQQDGGMAYLSDIFDTPPVDNAVSAPVSEYAHHTRLVYEQRTDPTFSYRSGWRIDQRLRLVRVDVTSKTFDGDASSARYMVRRYHLDYQADRHVSLLGSVQVEGRCSGTEGGAEPESSTGTLPEATGCGRLPAMQFSYSRVAPFTTSGSPGVEDLPGWEGFDERIRTLGGSPPHSVDEALSDLFDINSDALPDILVTAPGLYGNGHALFLNGEGGPDGFGAVGNVRVDGVLEADANTIKLSNLNVAPLDLDGDGTIDLLHMPKVKTYSVYRPELRSGSWWWAGREVMSASNQNPKIDFGNDTPEIQVLDVNFDGLVDVVVTTGTELQTFLSLGRLPNGYGQFGYGQWASASTSTLSTDPIRTCVPWSGNPVRFSDAEVRLADMNGDGITDIVRLRKGAIQYWPGRGNGFWGTGARDDCAAGTFGEERHIAMDESPEYSDIQGDTLRLDDVNGDGLADLVQVRMTDVDIWINEDGVSWTDRHIIVDTPASPAYANRVRLVDVNGSGTRDILWGDGNEYKYLDLEGGQRSWMLVGVDNGLGKSTTIEYSTSTAEMLEAESNGACTSPDAADPWNQGWCSKMPTVAHVVKRVTESSNLSVAGQGARNVVTEYSYRDPVFEGRQREFRGFRRVRAHRIGDSNSPTDVTESVFLLGECQDENPDDEVDSCALSERWRDNPREALKGLPIVTEKLSEGGVYLSTEVTQYRLKHLYTGLDGRAVRHAVQVAQSSYLYDTGPFSASGARTETLEVVDRSSFESGEENVVADTAASVPIRSGSAVRIQSEARTDAFGNREIAVSHGCTNNCASSDGTVSVPDEPISTVTLAHPIQSENSRWLWRTVRSWVAGGVEGPGVTAVRRNEQTTTYDEAGDPTAVNARLAGSLSLYRPAPATNGPQPADAAADGDVLLSGTEYDLFGNPTTQTGANHRCTTLNYDSAYAALPTSETVYPEGCPGGTPVGTGLTVQADAYDRGFGLVTVAINMQLQPTRADYDEFGRIVRLTRPHPTVQGDFSPEPSVEIEYFLPPDISPYYSAIHTRTQDGATLDDGEYVESWAFVDGFGRTLVTLNEADPDAAVPGSSDDGEWIVSGQVDFDSKSAVRRKYLEYFWDGSPETFPVTQAPTGQYGSQRYDAFGRQVQTIDLDGTVTLQSRYHALSTDLFDAADLEPGPHQGTYASTRKDGHGRTIVTTERAHSEGALEARHVITQYLPTGEPRVITRRKGTDTSKDVVRWLRYDSLGRMVLNVEPNTSMNDPGPLADTDPLPGNLLAWRYAYNVAGDLVGTSDARGCGINFTYDGVGRLLSEDYCRCEDHHAPYSDTQEVTYHYDVAPSGVPSDFGAFEPSFNLGRLIAVRDLASETWSKYDGLGRVTRVETRIARPVTLNPTTGAPPVSQPNPDLRYAAEWYYRDFAFDAADREIAASTGSRHNDLRGAASSAVSGTNTSVVTTTYTRRGTIASVGGSYGSLVASIARTADGLIKNIVYGDAAVTTTASQFDNRRRLRSIQTYRTPPDIWSWTSNYSPVPGYSSGVSDARSFQLLLQDEDYTYDSVGNPTEIRDWRISEEWPDGAKPAARKIQYDDLYRVSRVDYQYGSDDGTDTWVSPNLADETGPNDQRRATPSPQISFDNRTLWQTFQYDWLGNNRNTDDDAHGFYDRSLGTVTENSGKPYQLNTADNTSSGGSRIGSLTTEYDEAGNLTQLIVDRGTPCTPIGASCDQRFEYAWDEVGRLVRARRFDASTAPGTGTLAADLRYRYDAGDQRVVKTAVVGTSERHTVYIFDSLELRRTTWSSTSNNYNRSNSLNEVPYLFVNGVRLARVVYEPEVVPDKDVPEVTGGPASIPGSGSPRLHVLFELGDHLGSTNMVLDKETGELVEKSSFLAYGAAESDYRADRWEGFREDYRFTGKEEDVEVGLVYFGKRFLNPMLGRWVSADPLGVHVPTGEKPPDLNLYAYVKGALLAAIDPLGLDPVVSSEKEYETPTRTVIGTARQLADALKLDEGLAVDGDLVTRHSRRPLVDIAAAVQEKSQTTGRLVERVDSFGHAASGLSIKGNRFKLDSSIAARMAPHLTANAKIVIHGCGPVRQMEQFVRALGAGRTVFAHDIPSGPGMPINWVRHTWEVDESGGGRYVRHELDGADRVIGLVLPESYVRWWASIMSTNELRRLLRYADQKRESVRITDDVRAVMESELDARTSRKKAPKSDPPRG